MYKVTDKVSPSGFFIIEIESGEFSGVEYYYTSVGISEDKANDIATLKFEYIVTDGSYIIGQNTAEFKNTIGDILSALMEKSAECGNIVFFGGK